MKLLAFAVLFAASQAPRIEPREFDSLRAAIVPSAQATWQAIPWRIDLLAARAEALRDGKPLFLWTMNGHPLGCT